MQVTLTIKAATHTDAHSFVCAFNRTRGYGIPPQINQMCTVDIEGTSHMTITTPSLFKDHADALMREFDKLLAEDKLIAEQRAAKAAQ